MLSIFFAQDDKIQVAQVGASVRASSLAKSQLRRRRMKSWKGEIGLVSLLLRIVVHADDERA
ncbi:MAG: hypothetical protein OXH63_28175, partial [Gemmatimonadetes bacterium]|nr:hypothetical protein [Gemmatimonadota bacterium]